MSSPRTCCAHNLLSFLPQQNIFLYLSANIFVKPKSKSYKMSQMQIEHFGLQRTLNQSAADAAVAVAAAVANLLARCK